MGGVRIVYVFEAFFLIIWINWYQYLPESCVTIVAVDSEPNPNEGTKQNE